MMQAFYDLTIGGITLRRSRMLDEAGVKHAFCTKAGGFGEGVCRGFNFNSKMDIPPGSVDKNIALLAKTVGFEPGNLARTLQVHEDTVNYAHRDYSVSTDGCDGLYTDIDGKALMVLGADCIPVLLYDPERKIAAAVHSGWRGTAMGVSRKAVTAMVDKFGCFPGNILAAIGPGIGGCCFETDSDVPAEMIKLGPFAKNHMTQKSGGKWMVDLKGLIRDTLLDAGVENISVDSDCTRCLEDKYWSHRRLGSQRGTQAAVIAL